MKQIKQESGRSMVEMLGVLAVIGVLSVGGISGYTLAMNKHRANSVAADLMKRAVVVSGQRQLGQTANLNGFNNQVGDYSLDSNISTDDDEQTFGMTVKAVPQEVCKKILALDWDNATISPAKAEDCDGGDMTFTYNNDLSPVSGSNAGGEGGAGTDTPQEPTCEGTGNGCQKCENGEWVADETLNDQPCGNNANTVCSNGICGCPNGGSLGTDGQTCCLDGYVYKGVEECSYLGISASGAEEMARKGYCTLNIPVCGCEETYGSVPSATKTGCCLMGYYDEGYWGYWSFGWNNVAECNGCGSGQLVEKDGQKYCCGGKSYAPYEAGPYDISNCKDSECSNPSSDKITQVCCEATSGMKWCASTNTCVYDTESCSSAPSHPSGGSDN